MEEGLCKRWGKCSYWGKSDSVQWYQEGIENSRVKLGFAVSPGVWLLLSNLRVTTKPKHLKQTDPVEQKEFVNSEPSKIPVTTQLWHDVTIRSFIDKLDRPKHYKYYNYTLLHVSMVMLPHHDLQSTLLRLNHSFQTKKTTNAPQNPLVWWKEPVKLSQLLYLYYSYVTPIVYPIIEATTSASHSLCFLELFKHSR